MSYSIGTTSANLIETARRNLEEECALEGKHVLLDQLKVLSGDRVYAEIGEVS